MKLAKAIEILEVYMQGSDEAEPVDFNHAVKLGTQALKRIQNIRNHLAYSVYPALSGETEK